MRRTALFAVGLLGLAACGQKPAARSPASSELVVAGTVQATGETVAVATANADAADDPAIWRNPADPSASLIVGTDKKAGLYVYGLDGKVRAFIDAGRVNNVDLLDGLAIAGAPGILVGASDRNDEAHGKLALFRLDPKTAGLSPLGKVEAGAGEAYGVCFHRDAGGVYAFMVMKDGTINQVVLDLAKAAPAGRIVRTMKLATQAEGCVADERTGRLYVAEEDVGLWRFDAAPTGGTTPLKVFGVDGERLVADAEGVAIAKVGADGGYVLVSSQGDNAYTAFRLPDETYAGRFRIVRGALGSTEETDGIDVAAGDFGPAFPGGLFVAQDGENDGSAQNFKLVPWNAIESALRQGPSGH
jgi:3-phytase